MQTTKTFGHGLDELFTKYGVETCGMKRIYNLPLEERSFNLECTTPFSFEIKNEIKIETVFWTDLVEKFAAHLQKTRPINLDTLYSFRVEWSRASLFSKVIERENTRKIDDNLYVSVNFTAQHAVWFIQDLLVLYGVDINLCSLKIRRLPSAEPQEIQDKITEIMKEGFYRFLISKGKTEDFAIQILKNIDVINKMQKKLSLSYLSFYLFSDTNTLASNKAKFIKDVPVRIKLDPKQIETLKRCLDYLTAFYTEVFKFVKANY